VPWLPLSRLAFGVLLIGAVLGVACRGSGSDQVRIVPAGRVTPAADQRVTVFIDAGHGGSDPGWGSSYILDNAPLEKDLTLDVAKRTAAYLEAEGYRAVLSRTADTDVNDPERDVNGDGCIDPIDELQARMDIANASGAAVLFSIHFNGLPNTPLNGSATFYNAVREFSADNERLAELIQAAQLETLRSFGHDPRDWGALHDDALETPTQSECPTGYPYYTILGPAAEGRPRPTMMPGAVAEAMFLTHPVEARLAGREDVRDQLAKAYAEAIKEFLIGERSNDAPRGNGDSSGQAPDTSASRPVASLSGPATLADRGKGEPICVRCSGSWRGVLYM